MVDFVTKDQAKSQIRLQFGSGATPDDDWLDIWIPIISQAVALWLKDPWRPFVPEVDSNGDVVTDPSGDPVPTAVVQPVVRGATLLEMCSQFRFREGEGVDNVVTPDAGYGYVLNKASTALLTPLRKSTVA